MRFSEDEERFLKPGCDRLVALAGLLAARSVPYSVARTGGDRHVIVRIGKDRPVLALAAHYDRVEGSPGILDNSCACLQLVALAASLTEAGRGGAARRPKPLIIAFTDAEEAPSSGAALSQGSFGLAKALSAAPSPPPAIVLDVTGRGDRLVYSTSAELMLSRAGMALSRAAEGRVGLIAEGRVGLVAETLAAAARAGLEPPLPVALPWSDDLGLTLGGLPALAVSLLPSEEAALCARGGRPATWDLIHGPDDGPGLAQDSAFRLMSAFLSELALG